MATATENEKQIRLLRIMVRSLSSRVARLEKKAPLASESEAPVKPPAPPPEPPPADPDPSKMNRADLVEYATAKGIECDGKKMSDILAELG
jgi:hypothetical protein